MKKPVKQFDLASMKPEKGLHIVPRSEDTIVMFNKLNELEVGDCYTMPKSLMRTFINAKTTLKRMEKKVIIYRNIDKYNFRCWRLEDGKILTTRRKKDKK